jgi:hypothetical protein
MIQLMSLARRGILLSFLPLFCAAVFAEQGSGQDDKILERGDKLLEEAKTAYDDARAKNSAAAFVDAGFRLEEARIKFIVLQEIGSPDNQKIATDRLRAVNQLSKLIHDGKVAISGTPADSSTAKPGDRPVPAPAKDPGAEGAPVAVKPAIDVMKRSAMPEAAKQREAEKLVRDLFKEQYAKKAPNDRKALIRLLLDQGKKSQDDPASAWVLYREAQEIAVQVADPDLSIEAIESAARLFDIDALSMKSTALAAVGKAAKSPEEFAALAEAMMKLVEELILADQYEPADKMIAAALQYSKRGGDAPMVARATTRSKEVAEAKSLYQSQRGVLQALAKNPEDSGANLEMGKFLCYVKGSWDLGLRFLIKGSDPALKSLAERELSNPVQASERAALGDGWFDLAEKDKSPLRKSQLLAHAKTIYESAVPEVTALLRAKIEKRLESMNQGAPAAPLAGAMDLLRFIDVKRDTVAGEWSLKGGALLCTQKARFARLQIPFEPPDEYDIAVVVERKEGFEVYIGLARGSSQFYVALDDWAGTLTAIGWIDGRLTKDNESAFRGKLLTNDKPYNVLCSVRKDGVSVSVDGKKITSFKGSSDHLSNSDVLPIPNRRALYVGCNDGRCTFSKVILTTVSGQGKVAR